ncbi:SUCCINIC SEMIALDEHYDE DEHYDROGENASE family protein [Salix suchowensis]|nr:SUCCINIC SEMIALDEHYDE DEHYDROGENASE family protein [Salix suchowensis]
MGKAPDIGDASCASPEVRKIIFAASTAVRKKSMAGAAGTVKRLAAFRNSGQTCVCANRIILQEEAVQSLQVGDGFSEGEAQTSQTGGLAFDRGDDQIESSLGHSDLH